MAVSMMPGPKSVFPDSKTLRLDHVVSDAGDAAGMQHESRIVIVLAGPDRGHPSFPQQPYSFEKNSVVSEFASSGCS